MQLPPKIGESTEQERREYVLQQWECMHNCEFCGKCKVLRGRDVEELYAPELLKDLEKAVSKPPHRAVGIQKAKKGE